MSPGNRGKRVRPGGQGAALGEPSEGWNLLSHHQRESRELREPVPSVDRSNGCQPGRAGGAGAGGAVLPSRAGGGLGRFLGRQESPPLPFGSTGCGVTRVGRVPDAKSCLRVTRPREFHQTQTESGRPASYQRATPRQLSPLFCLWLLRADAGPVPAPSHPLRR